MNAVIFDMDGTLFDTERVYQGIWRQLGREFDLPVSDAFLPVGGEVIEFNDAVDADPSIVNKDAYGEGWLVKVKMSDPAEYDALLSPADYEKLIG